MKHRVSPSDELWRPPELYYILEDWFFWFPWLHQDPVHRKRCDPLFWFWKGMRNKFVQRFIQICLVHRGVSKGWRGRRVQWGWYICQLWSRGWYTWGCDWLLGCCKQHSMQQKEWRVWISLMRAKSVMMGVIGCHSFEIHGGIYTRCLISGTRMDL